MLKHQILHGANITVATGNRVVITSGVAVFAPFNPSRPASNSNEVYKEKRISFKGLTAQESVPVGTEIPADQYDFQDDVAFDFEDSIVYEFENETSGGGGPQFYPTPSYYYVFWNKGYPKVIQDEIIRIGDPEYIPICLAALDLGITSTIRFHESFKQERIETSAIGRNLEYLSGKFSSPADADEDNVILRSLYHIELISINLKSDSGTCDFEILLNGIPITPGLNVTSALTTEPLRLFVPENSTISIRVSNNASVVNAEYQLNYRKVLGDLEQRPQT